MTASLKKRVRRLDTDTGSLPRQNGNGHSKGVQPPLRPANGVYIGLEEEPPGTPTQRGFISAARSEQLRLQLWLADNLRKAMASSFGSVESARAQFAAATKGVEASGWGVVAVEPNSGRVLVLQAEKHQDLGVWGAVPLLVCDVWEHAYYLKYQNRRAEYVKNFLKVVQWKAVAARYERVKGLKGYR